jgi:lipoate-protein ligase A
MNMTRDPWFLLVSGPGEAAFNMALDEALLESMPRLSRPVLRFYGWLEPAATFGYFQRYNDVARLTPLRPLVRRPTGGGLVPHDRDWTYSAAFPTGHEWYALSAVESYRRVHDWIRGAFAWLGADAELAPVAARIQPGQCFAGYERFDVLSEGRKIAGAAQRRRKDGLLIQGSVQPAPGSVNRERWEDGMRRIGETESAISWTPFSPDRQLLARANTLAKEKYSQAGYNEKR